MEASVRLRFDTPVFNDSEKIRKSNKCVPAASLGSSGRNLNTKILLMGWLGSRSQRAGATASVL